MKLKHIISNIRKKPKYLAYMVGILLVLLVIISKFFPNKKYSPTTAAPVKVYATPMKATPEIITLRASGVTKASRKLNLLSETNGQIYRLHCKKGSILNTKDPVATIQLDDRNQLLKEAKAAYNLAKEKLDVTKKLAAENFRSELNLKTAQVEYESAAARLAKVEKEIANTRISAPFKGVLGDISLEEGSVVGPGALVATLLGLDPILVQIYISEKDYGRFQVGSKAHITFVSGETIAGKVTFVSSIADPKIHMFLVEISAENADFKIPEGATAQVDIPTNEQLIHKIKPSMLSMDKDGNMTVKVLTIENKVESYSIKVVQSKGEDIWVTGLPDETTAISYGGDFVSVGDTVQWEPTEKLKGPPNVE